MDHRTSKCNYSYIPTSEEYITALGSFGASVLVIGGLISVGLYILFFEQVFYTHSNSHRIFRRHIFWIASVYPLMAALSVLSLVVPRANYICTAVKIVYMSIGISHFTDLTLLMFGGEEVMLTTIEEGHFSLQVGPICCCCVCLPSPKFTKFSLRLVVLLSDQMPFTQAVYYFLVLVLLSANNINIGSMKPQGASLYLVLFNLGSMMSGVYALSILTYVSRGHLEHYSYKAKSFSMKTLVLVTNMQGIAFDTMGYYNVFPCIAPYLPPQVYKQTVENSIYLLEMMVLGTYTYWHYHNQQFLRRPQGHRPDKSTSRTMWARGGEHRGGEHRGRAESYNSTTTQSTTVDSVVNEGAIVGYESRGSRVGDGKGGGGWGGGDGRDGDGRGSGGRGVDGRDSGSSTSRRHVISSSSSSSNGTGSKNSNNASSCRNNSNGTDSLKMKGSNENTRAGSNVSASSSSNGSNTSDHSDASSSSSSNSSNNKDSVVMRASSALTLVDQIDGTGGGHIPSTSENEFSYRVNVPHFPENQSLSPGQRECTINVPLTHQRQEVAHSRILPPEILVAQHDPIQPRIIVRQQPGSVMGQNYHFMDPQEGASIIRHHQPATITTTEHGEASPQRVQPQGIVLHRPLDEEFNA